MNFIKNIFRTNILVGVLLFSMVPELHADGYDTEAQCEREVKGKIFIRESDHEISQATVRVLNEGNEFVIAVNPDEEGRFNFIINCLQDFIIRLETEGGMVSEKYINKGINAVEVEFFIEREEEIVMSEEIVRSERRLSRVQRKTQGNPRNARGSGNSDSRAVRFQSYSDADPVFTETHVFFATDRAYESTADVKEQFGTDNGELRYGICEVTIPIDHRVGELESPSILRFEFKEDPAKHVILKDLKLMEKGSFFNGLRSRIKMSEKKKSFLFMHGFNVSFEEAAKRTAQISYDLQFDGAPVFYSWPSNESILSYKKDERAIKRSENNIERFLTDYIELSGAEEIYLIAHSMGNRGLSEALISVLSKRPELKKKIKEIILAAPDIDARVFKRKIAPKMVEKLEKPITLYISSTDKAFSTIAGIFSGREPKVGDAKDGIFIFDGIDTIDASGIDTSFIGHSYFAEATSIISDIYDIIKIGNRPRLRSKLVTIDTGEGIYWKISSN